MRRQLLISTIVVAVWLALVGVVGAQDVAPTSDDALDIKSESLSVEGSGDQARFEGNVVVRRGDWVMNCSALTTALDAEGQVSRATAEGPVTLSGPELWVEAEGAVWERVSDTVVLTGESTVRRGKNRLSATAVTVHLADERVELSGVRGRFSVSDLPGAGSDAPGAGSDAPAGDTAGSD